MDKAEFIEKLQHALAGGLSSSLVAENVRYYQEYIDSEIRKGKSEAEVLEMLGEPRLIAKSIIEANKRAGVNEGTNRTYDEETSGSYGGSAYHYGDGNPYSGGSGGNFSGGYSQGNRQDSVYGEGEKRGRQAHLPAWLVMLIVTVAVVVVIGLAFSVLSFFSPVIIGVLIVILVVKLFQRRE